MTVSIPAEVVGELREALVNFRKTPEYKGIVEPKDAVLARFQPIFSFDHAPVITEDEFYSFLIQDNNHHWSGLHRHGPKIISDMMSLRKALTILLDEEKPVSERLDKAIDMVKGMGRNIATGILLVAHPDKYGVLNKRSEVVMTSLGIMPEWPRGMTLGEWYVNVNQVLLQLCDILKTNLWTLDSLWWYLDQKQPDAPPDDTEETKDREKREKRFGLERHLHDFLRDNWNDVSLGTDWNLYSRQGDEEAGYEFPTDVGRIDLLAKHKKQPRWLVIELKRDYTSDQTVGQLARYIGWVKRHLAEEGEEVHGLIICREVDKSLQYALEAVPNTKVQLYEVEFHLKEPKRDWVI